MRGRPSSARGWAPPPPPCPSGPDSGGAPPSGRTPLRCPLRWFSCTRRSRPRSPHSPARVPPLGPVGVDRLLRQRLSHRPCRPAGYGGGVDGVKVPARGQDVDIPREGLPPGKGGTKRPPHPPRQQQIQLVRGLAQPGAPPGCRQSPAPAPAGWCLPESPPPPGAPPQPPAGSPPPTGGQGAAGPSQSPRPQCAGRCARRGRAAPARPAAPRAPTPGPAVCCPPGRARRRLVPAPGLGPGGRSAPPPGAGRRCAGRPAPGEVLMRLTQRWRRATPSSGSASRSARSSWRSVVTSSSSARVKIRSSSAGTWAGRAWRA